MTSVDRVALGDGFPLFGIRIKNGRTRVNIKFFTIPNSSSHSSLRRHSTAYDGIRFKDGISHCFHCQGYKLRIRIYTLVNNGQFLGLDIGIKQIHVFISKITFVCAFSASQVKKLGPIYAFCFCNTFQWGSFGNTPFKKQRIRTIAKAQKERKINKLRLVYFIHRMRRGSSPQKSRRLNGVAFLSFKGWMKTSTSLTLPAFTKKH